MVGRMLEFNFDWSSGRIINGCFNWFKIHNIAKAVLKIMNNLNDFINCLFFIRSLNQVTEKISIDWRTNYRMKL